MKKNTILISIGSIAAIIAGIFIYRSVPPSFELSQCKDLEHSGFFNFGRHQHSFESMIGVGGLETSDIRGWTVRQETNKNGVVEFSLFKKGEFVKQLGLC